MSNPLPTPPHKGEGVRGWVGTIGRGAQDCTSPLVGERVGGGGEFHPRLCFGINHPKEGQMNNVIIMSTGRTTAPEAAFGKVKRKQSPRAST